MAEPTMAVPRAEAAEQIWSAGDRMVDLVRAVLGARDAPVGVTPKKEVWRKNKAVLYQYERNTPATQKYPVFLAMPLINRAYILDLRQGASFVQFLLGRGFEVFMLDWGIPGDEDKSLDVSTLITRYMPRAIRKAAAVVGTEQVNLVGYCIGGVLSACFTALYPELVKNLVLFTAPIDFSDAGFFGAWTARDVFPIDELADTYPAIPGELPDIGSKMLNPLPTTIGTYVRLWDKLSDPNFDVPAWQAMYRWVNEGVPFPSAAYRQWIKDFYQSNKLANGTLNINDRPVQLSSIRCPVLNVAASRDTIAPRTTTNRTLDLLGAEDKEELILSGGHVGTIVGRAASTQLWPKVADWLVVRD